MSGNKTLYTTVKCSIMTNVRLSEQIETTLRHFEYSMNHIKIIDKNGNNLDYTPSEIAYNFYGDFFQVIFKDGVIAILYDTVKMITYYDDIENREIFRSGDSK